MAETTRWIWTGGGCAALLFVRLRRHQRCYNLLPLQPCDLRGVFSFIGHAAKEIPVLIIFTRMFGAEIKVITQTIR